VLYSPSYSYFPPPSPLSNRMHMVAYRRLASFLL
jgi:hypothetical protein